MIYSITIHCCVIRRHSNLYIISVALKAVALSPDDIPKAKFTRHDSFRAVWFRRSPGCYRATQQDRLEHKNHLKHTAQTINKVLCHHVRTYVKEKCVWYIQLWTVLLLDHFFTDMSN